VWKVDVDVDWKDWYSFLLKAYNKLDKCKLKIKSYHIFTTTYINITKDDDGSIINAML
jgi:hypothetical protein